MEWHTRCLVGRMLSLRNGLVAVLWIVSLAWPNTANTATLSVAWDPSPGPNVAGYIVYWGTQSGGQSQNLDVGNQLSAQVTGLADGTWYYLVVRAYNSTGAMSDPSAEASGMTPAAGASPLPSISCPVPTASSSNGNPVRVTFSPTVTGGASPVSASCSPASGALFSVGNNPFSCTVTDALVRTASCSSAVVVSSATPPPSEPPSILVTPTTVAPGNAVTVSWKGVLPATATDWFGLYPSTASDTAFSSWLYVNCSQLPTTGQGSGTCTMTVPPTMANGSYNLRLFRNDGYQRLASSDLTIANVGGAPPPSPGPSILVTPTTVTRDGTVTVSWSGVVTPTATDWFGLYQSTASDYAFLGWRYVSCTQSPTTPRTSGSCSMTLPSVPSGSYSLRLFSNDGYQRLASSQLTVTRRGSAPVQQPVVQPLTISCPAPTAVTAYRSPVSVTFAPNVAGGVEPIGASCFPTSGSEFPVGRTNLTCNAIDGTNRVASCDSTVVVSGVRERRGTK